MPPLHRFLLAVLLLALPLKANGAELARRAFVGIGMATVPEAMRTGGMIPPGEGLLIERVILGSTAQKAGLQARDILLKLDQAPVRTSSDVVNAVRRKRAGDNVGLTLVRNGKVFEQQVSLIGLPPESSPDFETLYGAVDSEGALRRTIVTKPKGADRTPAVLFVGGIGCYSVDYPFDENTPYRRILADLTRQGFVTMRVEKTGMGDSMGEPCATADLDTEVAGYVAGLKDLKSKPYVDPDKVFIVGHSIGGIVGPLVAEKVPVRGLVVAETVGSTWFEYELINRRRQLKLEGMAPARIGEQMQLKQWCMHQLLIEKTPRAQILEKRPSCAEEMKIPSSDTYLQQIAAIDYAELWTRLKPETLVIYGSADFITSAEEHREIVEAINAVRPSAASYVEIPDMDHSFYRMKDQSESFRMRRDGREGETHPDIARIIGDWLKRKVP